MKKILLICFAFAVAISAKDLPTEGSIIEGVLENGFSYAIVKNAKPKGRAELRLLIEAGSLEEEDDQKGIAHFVEHMAFNGTKHFKKNDLISYLESTGVKFGSHLNASTSYERTLYKLTVPLKNDNLEKSFTILQDWAGGLSFDADEFDKERGVILEEARSRDGIGRRLFLQFRSLFFGDSRFMHREPIGDIDIIKNISVKRAKEFYDTWYRPELMHLVAVGDFNVTTVENLIKENFSPLVNNSKQKPASRQIVEDNTTKIMTLTDKELTSNTVQIHYFDKMDNIRTIADKRQGLIEEIIHRLFNMKASEQTLKDNPKAMQISMGSSPISSQKASYGFSASYKESNDKEALRELYDLIWSFEKYGFSQSNLELVKRQILSSNEESYKRLSDLRSSAICNRLIANAQSGSIYIDYDYDYNLTIKLIKDIKLEEVNALYRDIFKLKDRAILFMHTTRDKISEDEVLDIISKSKTNAKAFKAQKTLATKLLDTELKPHNIISKEFDKSTGIYNYKLDNNITIAFKQTDYAKNMIQIKGFSFGGYSTVEDAMLDNAKKSATWIAKSAPAKFTAIELKKMLSDKTVSASTHISRFGEGVSARGSSDDIDTMLELLFIKITQPKIDDRIINNIKKMLKSKVKQSNRNPKYNFGKELAEFYYQKHPRIQFDTIDSIEVLDADKMLEIYKDRFADMNNFHFVIVGDIDIQTLESAIGLYLGNLPYSNKEESLIDRKYNHRKGTQSFVRHYNNENIANITLTYKSLLPYTIETKAALSAMTSILNVRLRNLIREEKSGVYGIGVRSNIIQELGDKASARISFTSDPNRKDELITAIKEAIEQLKRDGVSQKELSTYREKFAVEHKISMRDNKYWLNMMMHSQKFDIPMKKMLALPKIVESISSDDIKRIAGVIFGKDILQAELLPKEPLPKK